MVVSNYLKNKELPLNAKDFSDNLINLIKINQLNLEHASINTTKTIWLGFSGGLDSRVLLELTNIALLSFPQNHLLGYKLIAVYINHGVNENANVWEQHCYKECKKLNINFKAEHLGKQFNLNKIKHYGSLEAALRAGRIAIWNNLVKQGDIILLAHHLNDQAETFFLRLLRGSGLTGLASIRAFTSLGKLKIIRPLLSNSRKQIKSFADQNNLNYITDDSNYNQTFNRNFLRHTILPILNSRWPNCLFNIASAAKHLQQVDVFVNQQAQIALNNCYAYNNYFDVKLTKINHLINNNKLSINKLLQYDSFLQSVILRKFITNQGFYPPSEDQLYRIYSEVIYAKIDSQPKLNLRQFIICRYRDGLYVYLPDYFKYQPASFKNIIGDLAIYFGDFINEASLSKAKKIFQKFGIPPWNRYDYPLIFRNKKLIAILGLWCCGL